MTASPVQPASAAMPSAGARARYRKGVDDVNCTRDDGTLPGEPRPIPTGIASPLNACCYRDACKAMEARALAAEAKLAQALRLADEAIGEVEVWAAYASPHFREKHNLASDLAGLRARVAALAEKT